MLRLEDLLLWVRRGMLWAVETELLDILRPWVWCESADKDGGGQLPVLWTGAKGLKLSPCWAYTA